MIFNQHKFLEGQHAFLSPSQYLWVNYDEEKLLDRYYNHQAAKRGTDLHNLAAQLITLGIKLPRTNKTLNMYVNDAIGFRMDPEVCLYYSENAFGTTDAISFRNNFLRVHDYKSGKIQASIKQLEIYQALFCLEYNQDPHKIESELRLYQFDEVFVHNPESELIQYIMDKIVNSDRKIKELQSQ